MARMSNGAVVTFMAWCAFMAVWFVAWRLAEGMEAFQDPYALDDERDTYSYGGGYGEDMPDFETEDD